MSAEVWDIETLKKRISVMEDNEMFMVKIVPDAFNTEENIKEDIRCFGIDKHLKHNHSCSGIDGKWKNGGNYPDANGNQENGGSCYGR